jgi:hypothetical protein
MQVLFTNVLGALQSQELIFLPGHCVAQDGTRVRANAGKGSFRTRDGLDESLEQAELHLKALRARMDDPPLTPAQQQARERGAMDVLDRIKKATGVVQELQDKRSDCRNKKRQTTAPKASTTDPDARIMKVSNGGFEPAYNVQLAAMGSPTGGPVTIIGVQVTSLGSDKHSILPMREQVEQRTGRKLDEVLVDGEHLTHEELLAAIEHNLTVIAPVPERWDRSEAPQDPALAHWIAQMKTEPMRRAYRSRKALIEWVNAAFKERFGLRRVPVRGRRAVLCVFLLAAVVLNVMQHGLSLLT